MHLCQNLSIMDGVSFNAAAGRIIGQFQDWTGDFGVLPSNIGPSISIIFQSIDNEDACRICGKFRQELK